MTSVVVLFVLLMVFIFIKDLVKRITAFMIKDFNNTDGNDAE